MMGFNQEQDDDITQKGRTLLTLIGSAGSDGINRKGLADMLHTQLSDEDDHQLDLLADKGFITVERVDIVDHPDVERLYRVNDFKVNQNQLD